MSGQIKTLPCCGGSIDTGTGTGTAVVTSHLPECPTVKYSNWTTYLQVERNRAGKIKRALEMSRPLWDVDIWDKNDRCRWCGSKKEGDRHSKDCVGQYLKIFTAKAREVLNS